VRAHRWPPGRPRRGRGPGVGHGLLPEPQRGHTEPYPSPTDVAQAPDPAWHYVIVSFRQGPPVLRSYRIVDGEISEETVALVDG